MEEFRVPIVDMAIFPLFIENKINKRSYFEKIGKSQYQLSAEGKAVAVEAVMKYLYRDAMWYGKKYSMKKIIENQIRLLARSFAGKGLIYKTFDVSDLLPILTK